MDSSSTLRKHCAVRSFVTWEDKKEGQYAGKGASLSLGCDAPLPARLILQVPHSVLVRELLVAGAALRQDAALEAAHVEEQVGVVLAVDGHEAVLPLHRGDGAGQPVLDVPEDGAATAEDRGHASTRRRKLLACRPEINRIHQKPSTPAEGGHSQVNVVLHQPHPGVSGPALFVVVAHNVLVVGVRVFRQVPLDQVSSLVSCEPRKPKIKREG